MEPNNIVEVKGVDTNNSSISNETNVLVARKIKKKKRTEINEALEVNIPKRKNDGKHNHLTNLLVSEVNVFDSPMKKKKKHSDISHDVSDIQIHEENSVCEEKSISRKKKKVNDLDTNEVPVEITHYETTDLYDHASVENSVPKKKKRKHVDADEDVTEENLVPKKKKKQINFNESLTEVSFSEEMSTQKRKKNPTGYEDLVDNSSIVQDKTVNEELGSKRKKGKNKKLSENL
ncbi:hypothetical protein NQ317_016020 [Molorchus minor]|uniref:Uncharacterized protein n=1 Tax=Molorchus minor TaxID=1323400 RepID=A0ABQ9JR71_9CUCU|nr:hypothetical protein NQ317_016020 [Molorchus minor]